MDTNLLIVIVAAAVAAGLGVLIVTGGLRRRGPEVGPLVEAQSLRIDRLADALLRERRDGEDLRGDLARTREVVEALRAHTEERRRSEEEAWDSLRRMHAMFAGTGARGRAGENVLGDALGMLPAGLLERDFRVNGSVVEFALVLPDGRRLPVDSKWTAVRELECLEQEEDPDARRVLERDIERAVSRRAGEVAGYLDPSATTPFAVACIPDAAYEACRKAHAEAFARRVVLAPASTALPLLLSLYVLATRFGRAGEAEDCLAELDGVLGAMEQTLENKVVRATTMLANAADDWRTHLGRARGALARGRGSSAPAPEPVQQAVPWPAAEDLVARG